MQPKCLNTDAQMAHLIAVGDECAIEQFYAYVMRALRSTVVLRLPEQEPDDILHETFTLSLEAIQNGGLRNPRAIRAYTHVILKRLLAARIGRVIQDRTRRVNTDSLQDYPSRSRNPESSMLHQERADMLARGMRRLHKRDSELLTRFYLNGQPSQEICLAMHITEQQFNNFKHRAKATLTAWVSMAATA